MRIAAVGSALPPHYYDQATLLEAFKRRWAERHHNLDRLERLHHSVLVGGRHLALPMEAYDDLTTWGKANDAWIRVAQEVGERAVLQALDRAGLEVDDVDCLISVTVTGVATPSIDARLMNRLGLPSRVKRVPIFGLGCVAGTAGIARAADYVRAFPDQVAVLLSVELCSLTLQREDLSIPNLIASGLFGDGAAAAIVVGENRSETGPSIVASQSIFYPDSEEVMGWDISESGFKIVLSAEVPEVVRRHLRADVDGFLADHGLTRGEIATWVSHPGGPRSFRPCRRCSRYRTRPSSLPGGVSERSAICPRHRFCLFWRRPFGNGLPSPEATESCSPWVRVSVPNSSCFGGDAGG